MLDEVTAGFLCCFGVKSCFWFGLLLIWSSNDEEEKTSVSCDSLVWTSVHSHGSGSSLQVHGGAAVTTVASHQEGPDSKSTARPRPLQTCMSAHSSTVPFFLPQSKDTLNLVVLNWSQVWLVCYPWNRPATPPSLSLHSSWDRLLLSDKHLGKWMVGFITCFSLEGCTTETGWNVFLLQIRSLHHGPAC